MSADKRKKEREREKRSSQPRLFDSKCERRGTKDKCKTPPLSWVYKKKKKKMKALQCSKMGSMVMGPWPCSLL